MNLPHFITPNFITVARLLFVPVGVYTLFKNGGDDASWQYISWIVFFILGMSDILDGNLARSRNAITEFGKFLDPVADKVMIAAAMISLSILDRMPWWITVVILVREIGITFFRLSIIKRGVIAANKGGKVKSTFQNFAVGFYILPLGSNLFWFRDGFMVIAILLTIATGVYYVQSALKADR
ncbi:MAG: CDP-diacylglycerol--glycerol-3-phosphate 3-phosphatidyltransferase [Candidatus Planktophila sp.]|nr:CDP-diacylglycerol--glycerol-3-phosphate 3-phosphatidyltransferase [Candidatus Planktophila sp.]PHX76198.1 MAG: CDP-diacylglycerol--glycerol-3-phosphate 3-phosphatidyltransferase [Actinomycetota bacterium]